MLILPTVSAPYAAAGGGGAWAPTDKSGLEAWHKGDAGVTDSSDTVTAWTGQGTNAHSLTVNGDPQTNVTTENSLNVIDFDGTGDYFRYPTAARDVINGNASHSGGIVFQQTDNGGVNNFLLGGGYDPGGSDAITRLAIYINSSQIAIGAYHTDGVGGSGTYYNASFAFSSGAGDYDVPHKLCWSYVKDTSMTAWLDGVENTLTGQPATTFQPHLDMGARNGGTFTLDGWIGELALWDSQFGGTDRTDLDSYFDTRWGL